ncbi:PREDICTED: transcription initiation factor IIB-2-like [Camelina sativa]|uniref:Transcription initiation factor IIB-2-like n=1 Tax=Camelina sativa TaxID=90675 RepID=A0ABM0ZIV4_CAMSA|nr:PREDICTED: transcription initiation factor IIB-2-like [Camelina sativa]
MNAIVILSLSFLLSDPLSMATTKPNKASSDGVIVSISAISDGLELPARVKDHANEIFKEVEKYNIGKERKERNVLFAACIYIACRYSDKTRSMGEISVVANEAPIPDITKAIGFIAEKLNMDKNWLISIKAVDFIKRFCSKLGLDSEAVKAAQEAAVAYDNITDSSRSHVSVAARIVYAIARLSYEKKLLKDLSEGTGIAETTIKGTYKDLNLSTITPRWFAKPWDLKNLGRP